jgi:hypothetical protein
LLVWFVLVADVTAVVMSDLGLFLLVADVTAVPFLLQEQPG